MTNASSAGTARKLTVMAWRVCPSGRSVSMKSAASVEQRGLGVAKSVNRLLAVADHEDRGRQRAGGGAEALAPALDEQRHELPLRAARVLELVDEHVLVARLELVAAPRELLHLLEQIDGARQDLGEIQDRVLFERADVLRDRDVEDAPDAARENRVQVAAEPPNEVGDRARDLGGGQAVALPGLRGGAVVDLVAGAREVAFARLAVLLDEIRAQPVEESPQRRLLGERAERRAGLARQSSEIRGEHRERRPSERTVVQERVQPARHGGQNVAQPFGGAPAGDLGRQVARTEREEVPQHIARDQPPVEQRGQPEAQAALAELDEKHRQVAVFPSEVAADAQPGIERLVDEPRDLGLVGEIEAGIDAGFERELANEREAEGVDRRDGDLAEPFPQIAPTFCRKLRTPRARRGASGMYQCCAARLPEPGDDPLAHLGRRLAREGDREDVAGIDPGQQQVDVAIDQDARLAGSGRRFEHDVLGRAGRVPPGVRVRKGTLDCRLRTVD